MEYGVPRAREPIYVSSAAAPGGIHVCVIAGLRHLGTGSRTGDFIASSWRVRPANRIFRAARARRCRGAHAAWTAARPWPRLARLAVHGACNCRPGVPALSSSVRSQRHPADARLHRCKSLWSGHWYRAAPANEVGLVTGGARHSTLHFVRCCLLDLQVRGLLRCHRVSSWVRMLTPARRQGRAPRAAIMSAKT